MAMLAMTILVHFWVLYWVTGHLHPPLGPTCRTTLQPSHLGHARPASSLDLGRAWRVLCALTAHKPAHGHGHCHAHRGRCPDFVLPHSRAIVKCPLYVY